MFGETNNYLISECCKSNLDVISSGENGSYFTCSKCHKPVKGILVEDK